MLFLNCGLQNPPLDVLFALDNFVFVYCVHSWVPKADCVDKTRRSHLAITNHSQSWRFKQYGHSAGFDRSVG